MASETELSEVKRLQELKAYQEALAARGQLRVDDLVAEVEAEWRKPRGCLDLEEQAAWVDGTLEWNRTWRAWWHQRRCKNCRSEIQVLQRAVNATRSGDEGLPPVKSGLPFLGWFMTTWRLGLALLLVATAGLVLERRFNERVAALREQSEAHGRRWELQLELERQATERWKRDAEATRRQLAVEQHGATLRRDAQRTEAAQLREQIRQLKQINGDLTVDLRAARRAQAALAEQVSKERGHGARMVRANGDEPTMLPPTPVMQVLAEGKLLLPQVIREELGGIGGQSMGTSPPAPVLTVVGPRGTRVRDLQPVLRWKGMHRGAKGVVIVQDTDGFTVAKATIEQKGEGGNSWRVPSRKLARGKVYSWIVQVIDSNGKIGEQAPKAAEREARFQVLGEVELRALDHALARCGKNPMFQGIVYAQFGLMEEAERELSRAAQLPVADWQRTLAVRLLTDLRNPKHLQ